MSLEVFIYGPGYGEAILLRWRDSNGFVGALVDGGLNAQQLRELLRDRQLSRLRFVAATHPHQDHIQGLGRALFHQPPTQPKPPPVDQLWWWGGLAASAYVFYFEQLAYQRNWRNSHAIVDLLGYGRHPHSEAGEMISRPEFRDIGEVMELFQGQDGSGTPIRVRSLGPWPKEVLSYARKICSGIGQGGLVTELPPNEANRVSLGLLVEYGDAQVVLGGDMEQANWEHLHRSSLCPEFRPCLVKVSHHGSSTGKIASMWHADGFFGRRAEQPVAVITPWRGNAATGRRLPEPEVIEEIRAAGFDVYVTGQGGTATSGSLESHVHAEVSSSATVKIVRSSYTQHHLRR